MKNKIQKILVAMITILSVSTCSAQVRESYAGRGAWIGAIAGGAGVGSLVGFELSEHNGFLGCSDEPGCVPGVAIVVISTLGGAAIGSGIGALVGLAIPKHKNISVTPMIDPTPGNTTAGANLSFRF